MGGREVAGLKEKKDRVELEGKRVGTRTRGGRARVGCVKRDPTVHQEPHQKHPPTQSKHSHAQFRLPVSSRGEIYGCLSMGIRGQDLADAGMADVAGQEVVTLQGGQWDGARGVRHALGGALQQGTHLITHLRGTSRRGGVQTYLHLN